MHRELQRAEARVEIIGEEIGALDRALAEASLRGDAGSIRELGRNRSRLAAEEATLRERAALLRYAIEARELAAGDPAWLPVAAEAEGLLAAPGQEEPPSQECLLEVRAGVGGADACLFAAQLAAMYLAWAGRNGWEAEESSAAVGKEGLGVRRAALRVAGPGVLDRLFPEAGVHRIQRVPATEARGRVHTSTATVAVLPLVGDGAVPLLDWADIRTDTFRSSGNGGQSVNTTDSAVRLVHGPTGIEASSSTKSQHRNKELAYAVLCRRVAEASRRREEEGRARERRTQIGDGSQSGRTRNYDVPEDVVVDYATGARVPGVARLLAGDLSPIEGARR